MPIEHHPLVKEFPEHRDVIHQLMLEDPEFRALLEEYREFDREIYRVDQDTEPTSDERAAQLKRRRVFLKDKLYQMIEAARAAARAPAGAR